MSEGLDADVFSEAGRAYVSEMQRHRFSTGEAIERAGPKNLSGAMRAVRRQRSDWRAFRPLTQHPRQMPLSRCVTRSFSTLSKSTGLEFSFPEEVAWYF